MEQAFRNLLLADSAVSAIVGTRVNWAERPQASPLPAIVLHMVSDNNGHHMAGPDGLQETRVQVDAYADSYGSVKGLQRAVRAALDGYSGGNIQGIFHAGSRDGRDGETNEADRPHRVSLDFMTTWSE